MTTTLSRNLKLRIDSSLTANARYNLERLDLLGGTFLVDSTDTLGVRSRSDILIEPESADIGGSGVGGTLSIGTASHSLASVAIYTSSFSLSAPVGLLDQAAGGTKYLRLRYKSDITGSVDTAADRLLAIDLQGADRNLVLGGSLSTAGGDLSLTMSGNTALTLPLVGTVATLAGAEVLTNKSIDAGSNSITNLMNASIAAGAAISYSKLNLSASIVNADVAVGAAIAYTKLALTNSIVNTDISVSAAISRSKIAPGSNDQVVINSATGLLTSEPYLSKSRGGAGSDMSSVTFPSSGILVTEAGIETLTNKTINGTQNTITNVSAGSLILTNSIVNSDINVAAAIDYSKLNLSASIVNADISAAAAISRAKLALGTIDHVLINSGTGAVSSEAQLAISRGGTGAATANAALNALLPSQGANAGRVLQTDGTNASWAAVGTGSVTSVALSAPAEFTVSGSPITISGTLILTKANQAANQVYSGPTNGAAAAPTFRSLVVADLPTGIPYANLTLTNSIVNADVAAGAAISYSKLNLTGSIVNADVSNTAAIAYSKLNLSASIVNADIAAGAAIVYSKLSLSNSIVNADIAAGAAIAYSKLALTNSIVNADVAAGAAISYSKLNLSASIVDADIAAGAAISLSKLAALTASRALESNGSGVISASAVTSTELGYVSGVTSAIQTQLGNKQPLDADLTALAALATTGLIVRTGAGTAATRTITAGTGISVADGDGVAANPTITSTITQYTDEMAQDAVGTILTDTASIDFTYNDAGNTISAVVLPAGVDHNALANFVANKHVDHSTVQIATAVTSGLNGGGDITATRNIVAAPERATATSPALGDILLFADVSNANALRNATVTEFLALFGATSSTTWAPADGTTKAITHNFGTADVSVDVYDIDTGATLLVDSIVRTSTNVTTLTSSQAPSGSGWRVTIRK